MKIAVLMSTYNGEKYIVPQLASILAQQVEVDLIVRDDGSTDGTRRILAQYAQEGKLRWYTGENLRPAKSFLTLIQDCPGYDFYAFADQDDVWCPDKLSRAVAKLGMTDKPMLYFSNARLVDEYGVFMGRNVFRRPVPCDFYSRVCSGGVLGCTTVFNRALAQLVQEKPLPDKLVMHDSYLGVLCALFGGQILYDPEPGMDYRQHGGNVVGVARTKLSAVKDRWRRITRPEPVSIADMARSILELYPECPNAEYMTFLKKVAQYRCSLLSALSLAVSRKPRFNSINMAITLRLATALRKR